MSDLDIIQAIEKQINEQLSPCELSAVMSGNSRCSYVLNQQQQVIALNLQNCNQTDLSILKEFKNLTKLNLSLNKISQLTALKGLDNLVHLNLRKNNITDLASLKDLSNLVQLNLQDNQITEIKALKELKNLTVLNLQANQIIDLKDFSGISRLAALNLSANSIRELTPLKSLKQLIVLNLNSNQIVDLEPLQELTDLIELDLRFNQIKNIEPLKNLKKIIRLYLSSNKIINLDSLKQLSDLTHLYLSSNQISDLHALGYLNTLTELDLRANKIVQLEPLKNLNQLGWLYLENNQINDIAALQNLTKLSQLNLRNNQLTHIEPLKNFKNLNQLYLSNNRIQSLPKWIVDFNLKIKLNNGGDGISVLANPLRYPPPEIIRQGNTAIKAYFEELEQQQQRPLNEMKICFVGDSRVGKTSLKNLLCDEKFNPQQPSTQGIEITNWQYQNITAHCWDFGGDEKIQATHNLFFSPQCVYVLVLDNRRQRNEDAWLKKIEYLAGNVPILVVLNKCEQADSYDVDRKYLIKSYSTLQTNSFFIVSCTQELGLNEFKQGLINALKQVSLIKKLWPESWIQVKNSITHQLKQKPYVSFKFYTEVCQQHGIKELDIQEKLAEFLHNLGIFITFKKLKLLETYILESNWITKILYTIILSPQLIEKKGILFINELGNILNNNNYSTKYCQDLINLMCHLELCFLIDEKYILVPQLLEINEPKFELNQKNMLHFRIYYEYLNESVISRLMVALHKDIEDKKYWRTGVLLKNKIFNSTALVKFNYSEQLITIQVNGEYSRDYFSVIHNILNNIEETYE